MSIAYTFYTPAMTPPALGFNNTGAICWFNSLFQSLLSCSALNAHALEGASTALAQTYAQAVRHLLTLPLQSPLSPSTPASAPVYDTFASSRVLAAMLSSMRAGGSNNPLGATQECADEGFVYFVDNIGPLRDLFTVEYESYMRCACGHRSDPVRDRAYQIELFADTAFTRAQDLTDYVQNHSVPHSDYKCERCGAYSAVRHSALRRLRECIVIVFNKFYTKHTKWFPRELRFRALPRGSHLVYEQVAQIEHGGTMHGGHYWAIVRRSGGNGEGGNGEGGNGEGGVGTWYVANDTCIGAGTPAPTPNTYMVVYNLMRHETTL